MMYKTYIPKSEILRKYISNFNILDNTTKIKNLSYLAFPQSGVIMTLFSNAKYIFDSDSLTITRGKLNQQQILLLGKYLSPIKITYKEYVPELSINFTTLGLNYFFKESLSNIVSQNFQNLECLDWKIMTQKLFKLNDNLDQLELLESFLLKRIKDKDLSVIEKSLHLLKRNPEIKIFEIAKKLCVSQKRVYRYFNTYVGCTPSQFKKVLKFRNAILLKFNNPGKSLTEICYDCKFYDSPQFSRNFRAISHIKPSTFFEKITPVGEEKYPYLFL